MLSDIGKCVCTDPLEANILSKFTLKLKTIWKKEELPTFPSAWPCKYEFPRPIVTSSLQLWPTNYKEHSDVKVQMQLFGNKYGMLCCRKRKGENKREGVGGLMERLFFVLLFCFSEIGPKFTETLNMSGPKWYSWQPQQIT